MLVNLRLNRTVIEDNPQTVMEVVKAVTLLKQLTRYIAMKNVFFMRLTMTVNRIITEDGL